ncbi:MAG TPA: class I SAM-dependent methyltransferase [Candidatus Limnocylindrales bacterium]
MSIDHRAASGTWHYGLIARWWAEFNLPEPAEVAYYGDAIRRYGEPALDCGCGTGRLLLPLLAEGLDVDGVDVSGDMIALAAERATEAGHRPLLRAQATHELDLPRRYSTIFMCGVFGLGGRRDRDRDGLRRVREHLEPGGALVLWHELPFAGLDPASWAHWLPGHRSDLPRPWPATGDRREAADGDEIELLRRMVDFDPRSQRQSFEIRARLWRGGGLVQEETYGLHENLYFEAELALVLEEAGFSEVTVEAAYERRPATADDATLIVIARV